MSYKIRRVGLSLPSMASDALGSCPSEPECTLRVHVDDSPRPRLALRAIRFANVRFDILPPQSEHGQRT
jgi:hypothetical protein